MSRERDSNIRKDRFGKLAFRMGVVAAIMAAVAGCATGPSLAGNGTAATAWASGATAENCSSR
jgi:hypothetical protein